MENLPYGKGPGTKSDIDYITPPSSLDYYKGIDGKLPGLDPKTGIVPGTHNLLWDALSALSPVLRFVLSQGNRIINGEVILDRI